MLESELLVLPDTLGGIGGGCCLGRECSGALYHPYLSVFGLGPCARRVPDDVLEISTIERFCCVYSSGFDGFVGCDSW